MWTCVLENAMMTSRYPTPFLWDFLKRSVLHPSSLWSALVHVGHGTHALVERAFRIIQVLRCISSRALCTLQQFASLLHNLWLCGTTWCEVTWSWCVMFESLWWSSKLIRCQRMRLHPKHEDKPCASTEDFSAHCWLYWIIEILESSVATCTCVLHLAGLCWQGWSCSYFMLFQCKHVYLRTQWWSADIQHPFSETSWRDLFCIPHRSDRHLCMLGMVRMHWLKEHSGSFRHFVAFHQGLCAHCSNLQACTTICGCVAPRGVMWHDVTWCHMMWHDVRWCDIMWHDLTWCVMFESLWWSWKLIRCQRMRLHPKHEDKPCASTEDFSKICLVY